MCVLSNPSTTTGRKEWGSLPKFHFSIFRLRNEAALLLRISHVVHRFVKQRQSIMKPSITFVFLLFILPLGVSLQRQSTQVISGKGVYIFGPSLAEADSLGSDESEALNDFAYYSSKIASFVRAKGLVCKYISTRNIEVRFASKGIFMVYRDSVEFGTILTDGNQEPLLLKYVLTDVELEEKSKEYFKLK